MKRIHLILLVAVVPVLGKAQPNLDSLWNIWQDENQPDTLRLEAIQKFAWDGYCFSQPDSAFYFAQLAFDFAKSKDFKEQMALALNTQGVTFVYQGIFPEALEYFNESLAIREQLDNIKEIAGSLNNIGSVHMYQGNYPQALECLQKSLMICEELGLKLEIANTSNNIGLIYKHRGNNTQALEYFSKSLMVFEELDNKRGMSSALNNIGGVYQDQVNYNKALENYQKGLAIDEELGNKRSISSKLNNMGIIYLEQGNDHQALVHYQKSLEIGEELGDKNAIAGLLVNIGNFYRMQGNYNEALDNCTKGLEIAKNIDLLREQKDACKCLYETYKGQDNNAKALEYHEQMVALRDSLFNEANTKKITQLEMQYDFDKKEAATQAEQEKKDAIAAEELRRQKLVRNGFMGGFALVGLFAGVFLTQRNRIGKEKKRSEELLLNILPEEVAEELKAKGEADAVQIDHVTVLFTDFKGFTALSEQVTPKQLVKDLHECFSAFDHICQEHGLEKIKTIGDAYMAAGGLPVPNDTHAKDAIEAALRMRDFISEGKARKIAAGLPYFEIRIGIHTGPVVAGIVGVKKFSYDIWGDTVNTASRMESSGEPGKVNLSGASYSLVRDLPMFTFTPRGKVQAKGKGELEMYFVERG